MRWKEVDSSHLNAMTMDQLASCGMIVWPGGYAKVMSQSLIRATRERIRQAVTERGVGLVGFCAGAFITGSYESGAWGLGLIPVDFDYYQLEYQGVEADTIDVTLADRISRSLLWYRGPGLDGFGSVVARHPDGSPALAKGWVGKGFVFISGPHPEGPQSWRDSFGLTDPDGLDFELDGRIFDATLNQAPMPAF